MKGQEASLGCGSLIIIALIVLFCSGAGTKEVRQDVNQLRGEVRELTEQVRQLTREVKELRELEKRRLPAEKPGGG